MRPIFIQPTDPILRSRGDEGDGVSTTDPYHHHHPHHPPPCIIPDLTLERSRWSMKEEEAARLLRIQPTSGVVVGRSDRRHYHYTNSNGGKTIQGRHVLGTATSIDRCEHPKRRTREESNSTEMRNTTTLDPLLPNADPQPPVPHPRRASLPTPTSSSHASPPPLPRRTGSILKTTARTDSVARGSGPEGGGGPQRRRTASITFDRIEIREYARTIGDNPSCTAGPPIRYEKKKHTRIHVQVFCSDLQSFFSATQFLDVPGSMCLIFLTFSLSFSLSPQFVVGVHGGGCNGRPGLRTRSCTAPEEERTALITGEAARSVTEGMASDAAGHCGRRPPNGENPESTSDYDHESRQEEHPPGDPN